MLAIGSFLLPILVWCMVSYLPFIWHPKVMVESIGDVDYFQVGMLVDRDEFDQQQDAMRAQKHAIPRGRPANPIYLPAPHQVAIALYTAFTAVPEQKDAPWLHQGMRFGLAMTILMTVPGYLIYYAVQPLPQLLVLKQIIFGIVQTVILGLAVARLLR